MVPFLQTRGSLHDSVRARVRYEISCWLFAPSIEIRHGVVKNARSSWIARSKVIMAHVEKLSSGLLEVSKCQESPGEGGESESVDHLCSFISLCTQSSSVSTVNS